MVHRRNVAGAATLGVGSIVVWIIAAMKANKSNENSLLKDGFVFVGYEGETAVQADTNRTN